MKTRLTFPGGFNDITLRSRAPELQFENTTYLGRSISEAPTNMHATGSLFPALLLFTMLFATPALSQSPSGQGNQEQKAKPKPDEFKAIISVIEDAYKAPREVDKDILDELRKQYRQPTFEREMKIFKEIHRLYDTTPRQEEAILEEIRRSYERPTAEQEERIFREIRRAGVLPLGTVPLLAQEEYAKRFFQKLDVNADGFLQSEEMTESLNERRLSWDRDRDGVISVDEYGSYYRAQFKSIADGVASGAIPSKHAPASATSATPPQARVQDAPKPARDGGGKEANSLPGWFYRCDLDGDGQIGLNEWVKSNGEVKDFQTMDRNADGLLEPRELFAFLAKQAETQSGNSTNR